MSFPNIENGAAEQLIASVLRGETPAWPWDDGESTAAWFVQLCNAHGVEALVHERSSVLKWPVSLQHALRARALAGAAWEQLHARFLRQALNALENGGVPFALFKGTALAYSIYPRPHLRPRADTDILVHPRDRLRACAILGAIGAHQSGSASSEYLGYEVGFAREDIGTSHLLDLHWRIHYSQFQSRLLDTEALLRASVPLPALHPTAAAVALPHALLLTCIHRANDLRIPQWNGPVASYGFDRIGWTYDVHLQLQRMSAGDFDFLRAATEKSGLLGACRDVIGRAMRMFGTEVPAWLASAVANVDRPDPIASYHERSPLRQRWADLCAVRGAGRRTRFLVDHLLPPADYMRARTDSDASSPGASRLARLVGGMTRWTTLGTERSS